VAGERRKERFTALFHHISVDLLVEAFSELNEDAAPGGRAIMIRLFARVRLGEQVFLGVRFSPRDLARLALSAVVIVPVLLALTADHA
jgi:hypothetical protein